MNFPGVFLNFSMIFLWLFVAHLLFCTNSRLYFQYFAKKLFAKFLTFLFREKERKQMESMDAELSGRYAETQVCF